MDNEQTQNIETSSVQPPRKKKSLARKILKVVLYFILAVVGLNVLLYILLSIPYIQNKVKDYAVGELKTMLKTEVSIGEIRLRLFKSATLDVREIYIEDQSRDTLLFADKLGASLDLPSIIRGKVYITGINLDDFVINVNQKDSVSDFNFQFIVDAFSSPDSIPEDTTSSAVDVVLKNIDIRNGRLHYDVLSDTLTPGIFNASHIALSHFNAKLDLNSVDPAKLNINVKALSANESSGISIKNLSGKAYSDGDAYWGEKLVLELPDSRLAIKNASYNLQTNEFALLTDEASIAPTDLVGFLPGLKYLTHNFTLAADLQGKLPLADVRILSVEYGDKMVFNASGGITDLNRLDLANVNLSIDQFRISPDALGDFMRVADSTITLPDMLKSMGDIRLKGALNGKLSNLNLNAEAWSRQGAITLGARGTVDTTFTRFDIEAKLAAHNFNLRPLLQQDSTGLGRLTMHVDLHARQDDGKNIYAQLKGGVDKLEYGENNIRNVLFNGYYDPKEMGADINANLAIGKLIAKAAMTQTSIPDITVNVALDTLHVDYFYKDERWVDPRLSLRLNAALKGLDVNTMTGNIEMDSLHLYDKNFNFSPGLISFVLGKNKEQKKYAFLNSSILSASIVGFYDLNTLGDEVNNMMNDYLSAVFTERARVRNPKNDFSFNLALQNTEQVSKIFNLPVAIVQPGEIDGHIDAVDRQLDIKANFPHIRNGEMDLKNITGDVYNRDSSFKIAARLDMPMAEGMYKFAVKVDGANNALHGLATVDNQDTNIDFKGRIETLAQFSLNDKKELVSVLKTQPSEIHIDKLHLNVLPSIITNVGERTTVENFGVAIGARRYFGMDGAISPLENDTLNVYFDKAQIGDILSAFEVDHVKAELNGDIYLTALTGKPSMVTDNFKIADIIMFSDTLGTLNLKSQWSDQIGAVDINSVWNRKNERIAQLDGKVFTRDETMDLRLQFDRFPVNWLQPFLADLLNRFTGSVSADITAKGKFTSPETKGFLGFNDVNLGVDYTNVIYNISDTIQVAPDYIGFKNLVLKDNVGNKANVNATVTHHNFADLKYSLNMQMKNLLVLNTPHRIDSLFYGRVFASGRINIDGNQSGMTMKMKVNNDKNSEINILIPQKSQAVNYDRVVFINVPEEKLPKKVTIPPATSDLAMNLDVDLSVNNGITLGVVIDPTTGDKMFVKGAGNIKFAYNMQTDDMSAFGDYTISEGSVRVSLQGLKTLEFLVRSGSKLYFVGDPLKTQFDIVAYKRVKADLRTLDASFANLGSSPNVQVDCLLGIKGNMDKMELTYDISLPEADDDIQRRVRSFLTTDDQRIRQFAYLVAFNSFYSTGSGTGGGNITDGMWTSLASSTLSSGLNSILGGVLGDKWQVGANIKSNNGTLDNMDMSVNVSTRLFDDKLKLNTNVGYRTDQTKTNTFVGDFEVEYMLSNVWTLRAYNLTNDKFYKQAQYTQGVGIVYTKEAATLKRLFQSFRPRRRDKQTNDSNSEATGAKQSETKTKQPENTESPK